MIVLLLKAVCVLTPAIFDLEDYGGVLRSLFNFLF
jgi:hypothetical protein